MKWFLIICKLPGAAKLLYSKLLYVCLSCKLIVVDDVGVSEAYSDPPVIGQTTGYCYSCCPIPHSRAPDLVHPWQTAE